MIRAVVWKEFREQWLIGLTLIVLGGGVLVAATALGDPPSPGAAPSDVLKSLGVGRLAALMLVVTAGIVCGGALFAAEREAGTLTFLEVLPGYRWGLWAAKVTAGAALALAAVAALLAVAAACGLAGGSFAARLVVYGLLAFAWGTLGSTLARTTLGSVGIAVPAAVLATLVFLLPISILFAPPGSSLPRPLGWVVFEALMLFTPLALSGWRFTAPDRVRAGGARGGTSATRALAWLAVRQARGTALVLSAFALAFGFSLLAPGSRPVFVWPALALAAGVLVGITALGDEQIHRTGTFWAEGRLPIGRAWLVKVVVHLGLLAWLLALLVAPSFVRAQFEAVSRFSYARTTFAGILHDRLFDELGPQAWKYLLVPAVYGFAAGHLCGLLFRKMVVGCGVAAVVGGCLSAAWGPSLLAGGLSHWQVWPPAALLLLAGRVAARPWAADRLTARAPLARLSGTVAAALLALGAGIGWRVLEVSGSGPGDEDLVFVGSLPGYDENLGGRDFRAAAERYARAVGPEPAGAPGPPRARPRFDDRLETVIRAGWAPDPELAAWLGRAFADTGPGADEKSWHALAADAAAHPLGVYEHPQLVGTASATAAALDGARRMAVALLARGLQEQAEGRPEAFRDRFRVALALSRTLRNGGGLLPLSVGLEVERLALLAAERWLERQPEAPGARADRVRELAAAVEQTDAPGELDLRPHFLADRYIVREQMRAPGPWLAAALTPAGGSPEQVTAEADLVALAWTVPWERERARRLLGMGFEESPAGAARGPLLSGRPGAALLIGRNRSLGDLRENDRQLRALRRALILKLAVRAYSAENGQPPKTAQELTAAPDPYLRAVPLDPYAEDRPFGYRVSPGEELPLPRGSGPSPGRPPPPLVLEPGRVVLWSVGSDLIDGGGQNAPGGGRTEDVVFLVPPPPK